MRIAADFRPGADEFPIERAGLSRRSARGNLTEDGGEVRVYRLDSNYMNRSGRCRQSCAVTEIDDYRVSEMADAAVVIFVGLRMPVRGRLNGKRHHQESHQSGDDAPDDLMPRVQRKHSQRRW